MAYTLYDYVDTHGANLILQWLQSLQKKEKTKIKHRLDMLAEQGEDLLPRILAGSGVAGIFKLKTHGSVQLRPLLCRGPARGDVDTYTLLAGAKEVGSEWKPKGIRATAAARKAEVAADPENRRENHVQPAN